MMPTIIYRKKCSLQTFKSQEKAANTRFLILRKAGPLSFILKEEDNENSFKINIGHIHSCSCQLFQKSNDLCVHISWVFLKIFKLSKDDPITWQLGFTERELECIISKSNSQNVSLQTDDKSPDVSKCSKDVKQRVVNKDSECPICLENILNKHKPITYCRFGCGNNVHLSCMIQLATHQKQTDGGTARCPMCRSKFEDVSVLKKQLNIFNSAETRACQLGSHTGYICAVCHQLPIVGICYKCSKCVDIYFCYECFTKNKHEDHEIVYREKCNLKWKVLEKDSASSNQMPSALLVSSNSRNIKSATSESPVASIPRLPTYKILRGSKMLQDGNQCCLCYNKYVQQDILKSLPCLHSFHKKCIDKWMLESATCPVDCRAFTDEYIGKISDAVVKKMYEKKFESTAKKKILALDDFQIVGTSIVNSCPEEKKRIFKSESSLIYTYPKLHKSIKHSMNNPCIYKNMKSKHHQINDSNSNLINSEKGNYRFDISGFSIL